MPKTCERKGRVLLRLCVAGPRDLTVADYVIEDAIMAMGFGEPEFILVGSKRGIDRCALEYAKKRGIEHDVCEAEWEIYDRGAGPMRNMHMAVMEGMDALLAFARYGKPVTSGTASCISEFYRAGLYVYVRSV